MAITLLPKELRKQPRLGILKLVGKVTVIATSFYIFLILSALGIFVFTRISIARTNDDFNKLKQEIEALKEKEVSLFIITDRLKLIKEVQSEGSAFKGRVDMIQDLVSNDSTLSIQDLSMADTRINLTISAEDTFALERLLGNLQKVINDRRAKEVLLESLNRESDGKFISSLIIKQ